MKKFFISFVLIISLLFNVFADNKQAHKELREVFENYGLLPELKARGFDLKKLNKIDDKEEMKDYISQFFIDENGMPLDNHTLIKSTNYGKNGSDRFTNFVPQNYMAIEWMDEYGSKEELLKKGYNEDEIFYYPLYNDEWNENGYRVGKKYMTSYMNDNNRRYDNYSVISEKSFLAGLSSFGEGKNDEIYNEISKSDKEYLILDLSYNVGGKDTSYNKLVEVIKKMQPKEIFIMVSEHSYSMGEWTPCWLEKAVNIKTTIVGCPSRGAWYCAGFTKTIYFDTFTLEVKLCGKRWESAWRRYNIPCPTEGIGVTPHIYTNGNHTTSLKAISKVINDEEIIKNTYYTK